MRPSTTGGIGAPAEFTPLNRASPGQRLFVFVGGPLLWLAAAITVGLVVHEASVVELALIVTLLSFLVSLLVSATARRLRRHDEQEAAETR